MPLDRTRRRLLQLTGTVSLASLAGCASVANQFSNAEGAPRTSSPPPTETASPSTATATPATSRDDSTPADRPASTETDDDSWSTQSVSIDSPTVDIADVPVPDTRNSYALMGRTDATATATMFGNWKCPYTQEFVLEQLPEIVDRFVVSGDLMLEFRSVAYMDGEPFLGADAPRASRAGLAVWDADPQSYWSYFAHVFSNQPQERYEWAQPSFLARFAEASDVDGTSQIRRRITNGVYDAPVRTTAERAAELGVTNVPRVVAGGTMTAPTVDFQSTLEQISRTVSR